MGFYKAISVTALAIASYALYKTGALNPAIKCAAKASKKASDFADSNIEKAKDNYKNLRKKLQKEENDIVEGELITEE